MSKTIRLTENQFGEMMAYHGTGADFDKFNHKKYLNTGARSQSFGWGTYVTDDNAVAKGYSDNAKKVQNLDVEKFIVKYLINNYNYEYEQAVREAYDIMNNFRWTNNVQEIIDACKYDITAPYNADNEVKKEMNKRWIDVLSNLPLPYSYLYEVDIPDDNGHNYLSWYDTAPYEIYDVLERYLERYKSHIKKEFLPVNFLEDERAEFTGEDLYRDLEDRFDMCGAQGNKAASLLLMQCGFDGIKYPAGTRWQKPEGAADDAMNYVIFDANKVKIVNKTKV